jgi:hypothetical protein
MVRILVRPEALQAAGRQMRQAGDQMETIGRHLSTAFSTLSWEVRTRGEMAYQVDVACRLARALSRQAEEMARFLQQKSVDFLEADEGAHHDLEGLGALLNMLRQSLLGSALGSFLAIASAVDRWQRVGALVGAVIPRSMVSSLGWLPGLLPQLFPGQAPSGAPPTVATPPVPPPATAPSGTAPSGTVPSPSNPPPVTPSPAVPSMGGALQARVPHYAQAGAPWSDLRVCEGTWAQYGCTLTSLAMAISYHHPEVEVDRQFMMRLRDAVNDQQLGVVWGRAASYLSSAYGLTLHREPLQQAGRAARVAQVCETALENLHKNPPVPTILGVDSPPHWVVITGCTGEGKSLSDFTINDPGNAGRKTLADFLGAAKYRGSTLTTLVTITKQ